MKWAAAADRAEQLRKAKVEERQRREREAAAAIREAKRETAALGPTGKSELRIPAPAKEEAAVAAAATPGRAARRAAKRHLHMQAVVAGERRRAAAACAEASASGREETELSSDGAWGCAVCTFLNTNAQVTDCLPARNTRHMHGVPYMVYLTGRACVLSGACVPDVQCSPPSGE